MTYLNLHCPGCGQYLQYEERKKWLDRDSDGGVSIGSRYQTYYRVKCTYNCGYRNCADHSSLENLEKALREQLAYFYEVLGKLWN